MIKIFLFGTILYKMVNMNPGDRMIHPRQGVSLMLTLSFSIVIAAVCIQAANATEKRMFGSVQESRLSSDVMARVAALRSSEDSVLVMRLVEPSIDSDVNAITLTLPTIGDINFNRHLINNNPTHIGWAGSSGTGYSLSFIVQNGKIYGTLKTPTGDFKIYQLQNDIYIFAKHKFAGPGPRIDETPPDEATKQKLRQQEDDYQKSKIKIPRPVGKTSNISEQSANAINASGITEIDVAVFFTTAAAQDIAGTSVPDVATFVNATIFDINDIYYASGIPIKLVVVDISHADFTEITANAHATLDLFRTRSSVVSRRNTTSADVALLLARTTDAVCGSTTVLQGSEISADYAFSVISTATRFNIPVSCVTIANVAHEIGHIQGADHDVGASQPPTTSIAYAHGWSDLTICTTTIMGYDDRACSNSTTGYLQKRGFFSNPNLSFESGRPLGNATTANNARRLTETASTVAAFRTAGEASGSVPGNQTKSFFGAIGALINGIVLQWQN